MDRNSTPEQFLERLQHEGALPPKAAQLLLGFYYCYKAAAPNPVDDLFITLFRLVAQHIHSPFLFGSYHRKIRAPFDHYRFGLDLIRSLVDQAHSKVHNLFRLDILEEQLRMGENVILLANHQTESDPVAISLLLEPSHPRLAEQIIYIAGERVINDPIAVPVSMGCDLLCIYSKRYIDHPPELKEEKLHHNRRTLDQMRQLLDEGGKIIYVAPSGGRDRKNSEGIIEIAPFDPNSVELIYLMAKKSHRPTHFYPLALSTYNLLPPPDAIQRELGEVRRANYTPIALSVGSECDMERFTGFDCVDKRERRTWRAQTIWNKVCEEYEKLCQELYS